jgi:DNA-binding transcriptional LysR family regulator
MTADRWLGLELRHVAALQAIAEEGTFAAAAARLGYTQSAISQQIVALERIVGATLLERPRGRRPQGLTAAGELVLRHGRAMLARVAATQADLEALTDASGGPLRVGTYQSIGLRILPKLLPAFGDAWPEIEIEFRESTSDAELLALVEKGAIDLAFCMLPLNDGPFEALELLSDPYMFVVPAGSPFATKASRLTLKEIASHGLVCYRSCPTTHDVELLMRRRGIEPRIIFRSDDNATLQALVGAGVGAAFMPRLTIDTDDEAVVIVDVSATLPPRLIGVAWHHDREQTPAATAFIDSAREICQHLDAELAESTRG